MVLKGLTVKNAVELVESTAKRRISAGPERLKREGRTSARRFCEEGEHQLGARSIGELQNEPGETDAV